VCVCVLACLSFSVYLWRGIKSVRGGLRIYYYVVSVREREGERKSYVLPFVTLNNLVNWVTIQVSPSE